MVTPNVAYTQNVLSHSQLLDLMLFKSVCLYT